MQKHWQPLCTYAVSSRSDAKNANGVCIGFKDDADAILEPFGWGPTFLDINRELLDAYAACTDGAGVIAAQEEFLQRAEQEKMLRKMDNIHLGSGL